MQVTVQTVKTHSGELMVETRVADQDHPGKARDQHPLLF